MTARVIITGGPGFGKSSIIAELELMGYKVFKEISRQIIQKQIETGGNNTPWQDISAFSEEVFKGRIAQFESGLNDLFFYDRGLPDIAAFLKKDKKNITDLLWHYCQTKKYNKNVFITPPWEIIFHVDNERKEDFRQALQVHHYIETTYTELGYNLIPIPMGSVKTRAQFVLSQLAIN